MFFSFLEQILVLFPLILGAYLILSLMKLPDFSLESSYLFGAVIAFLAKGVALPFLLLLVLAGGSFVALTVGTINQFFRLPLLLSAIITSGLFHGLVQACLPQGGAAFSLHISLGQTPFLIASTLILCGLFPLLLRSELGFSLAIYGNNPAFFSHHALSSRFVVFLGLCLGHALSALSGFFFSLTNGFVDPTMNSGILLLALVSLMFGKLLMRTKRPSLLVAVLGVVLYLLLSQALLRLGFNLKYFNSLQALFVFMILIWNKKGARRGIDHLGV